MNYRTRSVRAWIAFGIIAAGLSVMVSAQRAGRPALSKASPPVKKGGEQGRTTKAFRIAVIVWTSSSTTDVNGSINSIRAGFFGGPGTGSHADFFGEISYGKWSITGDVYGYYYRHAEVGCFGGAALDRLAAADGYVASNYSFTVYVNFDCGATYAESTSLFWPGATGHHSRTVLGWNLGIGVNGRSTACIDNTTHSYVTWGTEGVTCTDRVFGDLGPDGQGEVLHYPAWQKQIAGLLDPSNVWAVTTSGVYTIAPLETPTAAVLMLSIQKDNVLLYDLEFRQPVGQDKLYSDPNNDFYRGVIIHRPESADLHALLDGSPDGVVEDAPTLVVGHTFYDAGNGVSITPLSVSPAGAQVQVNFGFLACVHANPTLTITPGTQISAPGANLLYSASVKNGDNPGCAPSSFRISGDLPSGFEQTPVAITVGPGGTGTAPVNIRSAANSAMGAYQLTQTATNTSAASFAGSARTSLNVQSSDASALFVRQDHTTQGGWQGVYGANGYAIPAGATSLPSFAQFSRGTATASSDYGVWWDVQPFSLDLRLTDGQAHQVTLYFTGQDNCGGMTAETVELFDATQSIHLDSRVIAPNKNYLVWNMRGHVSIKFSNASNGCPSVSGIFIDAVGGARP